MGLKRLKCNCPLLYYFLKRAGWEMKSKFMTELVTPVLSFASRTESDGYGTLAETTRDGPVPVSLLHKATYALSWN
jgi:hypothetical protein